jgi:hypothetical protein
MRTSFMKNKCKILVNRETFIPEIIPSALDFFNNKLSPSITRMKRRGDNGQPWQTPISLMKKSIGSPFNKTAKDEEVTKDIIQLVIWRPKPIFRRIRRSWSQSI